MKTTITEALADIKTSLSRIEKKRAIAGSFLGRDSRIRDPHEAEGGSREFVRRERQAIADLEEKIVRIRTAIQKANQEVTIEIEGTTRTVGAWLNWRREVSENAKKFIATMATNINNLRQQAVRQGQSIIANGNVTAANTNMAVGDLVVNVDETALAEEIDKMERILGTLDGRLSLINATTMIEV